MKQLLTIAVVLITFTAIQAQDSAACPCCTEKHRQFDFWLGNWEVFGPKGKLLGTNDIYLLHDSCVIQENWKSATGNFTGTSYNYYNSDNGEWRQTWVDNQGGSLELKGQWNDSSMVMFTRPIMDSEGKQVVNRITWTPDEDGSVRQLWDSSSDYGNTWQVLFDGIYRKKEE